MRIVDRVGLEPKKVLYVVEVAGRFYLLGSSEQGLSCLATLGGEETRKAFDETLEQHAAGATPAAQAAEAAVSSTRNWLASNREQLVRSIAKSFFSSLIVFSISLCP